MQHIIQQQLEEQRAAMDRAKVDLDRRQERREEQLARECERQATREWWGNHMAASTITWVHSGGDRGVQASRMEDWNIRMNMSTMANAADLMTGTIGLNEEMDLSLEEVSAMKEDLTNFLEEEDRDRHNQEQDRDSGMGGNRGDLN